MSTNSHVYFDADLEQWVGEFETITNFGEVHRDTQWFNTPEAAATFARTGQLPL